MQSRVSGISAAFILLTLLLSCSDTSGLQEPYAVEEIDTIDCGNAVIRYTSPEVKNLENNVLDHIPSDYLVMDTASGFLDSDNTRDLLVVLKYKCEGDSDLNGSFPEERPLLLLLGKRTGGYDLVLRNDYSVMCFNCGGVFGDPYNGISVAEKGFTIRHYGGSAWRWTRDLSFQFVDKELKWVLIEDRRSSFHASSPEETEVRVFTEKDFGKVLLEDFRVDKD